MCVFLLVLRTLPYCRCHTDLPFRPCMHPWVATSEALLIPCACPWGQPSPCSVRLCQPPQGTAGPLHRTVPQTAVVLVLQLLVMVLQLSVLALGKSVGVGLVLLTFFQFRSYISIHCTTQGCAVETWWFLLDLNQRLNSEKNICST